MLNRSTRVLMCSLCAALTMALIGCGKSDDGNDLEAEFRTFHPDYVEQVKLRNTSYLADVHPDLPEDMREFFCDMTIGMMKHAETQQLEPTIECNELGICKVTWPQPGDSWAAQSFIRHEGDWRFLQP